MHILPIVLGQRSGICNQKRIVSSINGGGKLHSPDCDLTSCTKLAQDALKT